MNDENKTVAVLLIVIFFSLAFYLWMTDYIETKKFYPHQVREWFSLDISDYGNDRDCIIISEVSAYYHNDISDYSYIRSNEMSNLLELQISVQRKCEFEGAKIDISTTDLDFPAYIIDKDRMSFINRTGNDSFAIFLTNGSELGSQVINAYIPIRRDFYNYYRFNAREGIKFYIVSFTYDDSFFGGYLADDSSFVVMDNQPIRERPVFSGRYKWYMVDGGNILFRFNPRSKFWSLFQKMLDTLVLGIIVVALYDLPWKNLIKFLKNLRNKLAIFQSQTYGGLGGDGV